MSEQEKKGFRVVDRRGVEREEPPKEPAAPLPRAGDEGGNREGPAGVGGGKRPDPGTPSPGGPTFLDLVMTLQMGAMANLGMVQSSDGRRMQVNLPAAKDSIDLLEVVQAKTKGNLTEEENAVLSEGLYHLRMAYVAAVNAVAAAAKGERGGGGGKT